MQIESIERLNGPLWSGSADYVVRWTAPVPGFNFRAETRVYYFRAKDELDAYTKAHAALKKNMLRHVLTEETYNALQKQD